MLKFGYTNETEKEIDKRVFSATIKKFSEVLAPTIEKKLLKRTGFVDLVLVNDETIQKMNKEYRKKNCPTDVLSFAYLEVTDYEKTKGDVIAGDIFISVDTAKKQAKEKGHNLREELRFLFVHGLLHCFGFDHKTDKQEEEMNKWANKVLS